MKSVNVKHRKYIDRIESRLQFTKQCIHIERTSILICMWKVIRLLISFDFLMRTCCHYGSKCYNKNSFTFAVTTKSTERLYF